MKIIVPLFSSISEYHSKITASSLAEPLTPYETSWVSGGSYTANSSLVYYSGTRKIYICTVTHSGRTTDPSSDIGYWAYYAPCTRLAAFDIATTSSSQSYGTSTSMSWTIVPGVAVNSIGFFNVKAKTISVTMKSTAGGTTVYTSTINFYGTDIVNYTDYMFNQSDTLDSWVLCGVMPEHATCEIIITVSVASGIPSIGEIVLGNAYEIGDAQHGASLSIIDYSTKTTNDYNITSITQRPSSRKVDATVAILNASLNKVNKLIKDNVSRPLIVVPYPDSTTYNAMNVLGYVKDMSHVVSYPTLTMMNMSVESIAYY